MRIGREMRKAVQNSVLWERYRAERLIEAEGSEGIAVNDGYTGGPTLGVTAAYGGSAEEMVAGATSSPTVTLVLRGSGPD